ncbi:MAG: hypothetical protein KF768_10825 [Phycisphaeraceae bacterium]|nr:hypothetical protein [Phycisphaeraceae bacterium]
MNTHHANPSTRRSLKSRSIACALGGMLLAACPAAAQLHEGDIILIAQNNHVVTGSSAGQALSFPQRVFAGAFGSIGLPNRTPDPGFNSVPGQFVTNALVDVRIRRAARKWNAADGNFCPIPDESVEIRKGTRIIVSPTTDPTDPADGPAITMGVTDPLDGLIHQHPAYWLTEPHTDGVYLIEVQVEAEPLAPSAPLWLLFSQNADAQTVGNAVAFAEATLAAPDASGNLCRCPADFNDDAIVDLADLLDFLAGWLPNLGGTGTGLPGDRNGDGVVDLVDLLEFLERWLVGC